MKKIEHLSYNNVILKDPNFFKDVFNVNTLDELTKNINSKVNQTYKLIFKTHNFKTRENFVGDVFEIFAECFFKLHPVDNRVGICNYKPVKSDEDVGVDGTGIGIDGKSATVQIKFRSNKTSLLDQSDLKQFPLQSILKYDVEKDTKTNMILFTNVIKMHYITANNLDIVRLFGYNEISQLINNNKCFWISLNNLLDLPENTI